MVGRKYETPEEFFGELEIMCNNAFTYNEDDSDVFKDAKQIKVSTLEPMSHDRGADTCRTSLNTIVTRYEAA